MHDYFLICCQGGPLRFFEHHMFETLCIALSIKNSRWLDNNIVKHQENGTGVLQIINWEVNVQDQCVSGCFATARGRRSTECEDHNINITNKLTSSNTIYRLPTSQLLQKRVENHTGLYNR